MKLDIIISSLGAGGAERVLTTLANHWASLGWEITMITLSGKDAKPFYPLSPKIHRLPLDSSASSRTKVNAIANNLKRVRGIRHALKETRPEAVLSFIESTNILTLLAASGLGLRTIISDRVDPHQFSEGRSWRMLRHLTYPTASALAVQTKAVYDSLPKSVRKKSVVIPNPVPTPHAAHAPETATPFVLAAGRLVEQKGFDLLLHAFARNRKAFPDWHLVIAGDGPLREELIHLSRRLGLGERVRFAGLVKDMDQLYAAATIFVLSSRFEGYPNVLCEAMSHGLPCVAARCPSGPDEIITHGENGLLAPCEDADALAQAMATLQESPKLRETTGSRATEIAARYSIQNIAARWESILRP